MTHPNLTPLLGDLGARVAVLANLLNSSHIMRMTPVEIARAFECCNEIERIMPIVRKQVEGIYEEAVKELTQIVPPTT